MGCDEDDIPIYNKLIISIHAPIVGCDGELMNMSVNEVEISIHAPIVGCDTSK